MVKTLKHSVWVLIPLLLIPEAGCTRKHYRDRADQAVDELLHQKTDDPRWSWALDGFQVYPPAAARFGDTSDPDRPPMPPDDQGAHDHAPNPQHPYHKSGVGLVEGTGYLALLEQWDQTNRAEIRAAEEEEKQKDPAEESSKEPSKAGDDRNKDGRPTLPAPKEDKPLPRPKPMPPEEDGEFVKLQKDSNNSNDPDNDNSNDPKKKLPAPKRDQIELDDPPDRGGNRETKPESSERILALSEDRARRELADATFFDRAMPEEESEKRVSKERTFLIKLDQAVELGLINSREYQTRREQVYLAALPVTLERFAFFPQVYGAGQVIRERINPQGPNPSQRFWTGNGEAGLTQLFPNGALLLLSFANRTVLNLTRSPDVAFSNISLDVVQPLLLGAGIAVNLEPLTQAERTLLYAIRDFAKFRQDFYVYLAGGQPNIPGIFTDTIRLNQDTVAVPDRFVPPAIGVPIPFGASFIRPQVTPGQGGRFPEIFTGDAPAQGYLSTLAEKAQLINQYRNIVALRRFLQLFRVYLEGGIVSSVQVNQVEQSLLRAIEDGLRQQANYRISLDQFKLQLGLPMPLRIEVEDTPLRPMLDQTRRYENISGDYERLSIEAQAFDNPEEADRLRGRLQKMLTESRLIRGTRIKQNLGKKIEEWAGVSTTEKAGGRSPFDQKLEPLYREREVLLNRRKELRKRLESDLSEEEAKKLQQVEFEIDLAEYERALRAYEQKEWKDAKDPMEAQRRLFGTVYQRFLSLLEEPYRERQEPVRRLWPSLPQVCVNGVDLLSDDDDVVLASISQAALTNRLDLMNRRAQLVDSWRKIRIAANRLLGTFNVQYHVDGAYSFGTPELFNIGQVRRQAIIDTELPIVRIQQRNEYRATLITYQRQRRELQKSEDRILYEARSQLRQLRVTAYNYQNIQKRAVELAYNQVDQALQAFSQPQQPTGPLVFQGLVGPPAAGGGSGDPAALTQQLLSAQNSLLQAQNALYNTWIAYLIGRMSLYREMGIMILDPRGVWIDDVAQCQCRPTQTPDSKPGDGKQEPKPGDAPPRAPDLPAPRPLVLPDLKTTN